MPAAVPGEPAPRPKSIFLRMGSAIKRAFAAPEENLQPPSFEISEPYNFQHVRHVKMDPHSSTGFTVSLLLPLLQ